MNTKNNENTNNPANKSSSGKFREFFKSGKNITGVMLIVIAVLSVVMFAVFRSDTSTFLGRIQRLQPARSCMNVDRDGDGYNSCDDCHDQIAEIYPGVDVDEDGSPCELDCEDLDPDIRPGRDNDEDGFNGCDDDPDDHNASIFPGSDADGDGHYAGENDCDDGDASVNPDAPELCGDHIDNDCNGSEATECLELCENDSVECIDNQPNRCVITNGVAAYQPIDDVCPVADSCYALLLPGGAGETGVINKYTHYTGCYENPTITNQRVENQYGYIEFAQPYVQPLSDECFFISEKTAFIDYARCQHLRTLLPVTVGIRLTEDSLRGYVGTGAGGTSASCSSNPYCQDMGTELYNGGDYQILQYVDFPPANALQAQTLGTDAASGIMKCASADDAGAFRNLLKILGFLLPGKAYQKVACYAPEAIAPYIPDECISWNSKQSQLACYESANGGKPLPNPTCVNGSTVCVATGSCKCPKTYCYEQACDDDACSQGTCAASNGQLTCNKCVSPETPHTTGDSCVCLEGCQGDKVPCGRNKCCSPCPEGRINCGPRGLCCGEEQTCVVDFEGNEEGRYRCEENYSGDECCTPGSGGQEGELCCEGGRAYATGTDAHTCQCLPCDDRSYGTGSSNPFGHCREHPLAGKPTQCFGENQGWCSETEDICIYCLE